MSSFFSSDGSTTIQFAIIFAVIFAVLAVAVFVFRRLTGRGQALSAKVGGRGRQPRLGVVDIYELDRQRQLILLRRDNVEHLLLVGGPNDVVVERNIARGVAARLAEDEPARTEAEPAAPEPARFQRAFEPAFEIPVAVPPPPVGSTARPDAVVRPLDPSAPDLFAPDDGGPQAVRPADLRTASPVAPESAAPPVAAPPSRPARRLSPSLANLVPSALTLAPGAAKSAPATEDEAALAAPADPAPRLDAFRPVDPAILSNMAQQLEQVVRRPSSAPMPAEPAALEPSKPAAVVPSKPAAAVSSKPAPSFVPVPTPAAPAEPVAVEIATAPPATAEPAAIDPMAAAMAATSETSERDDALFEPAAPEPEHPAPVVDRPIPPVRRPTPTPDAPEPRPALPDPAPIVTGPPAALPKPPSPEVAPPPAAVAKPVSELEKPPAGTAANPFSVEEIEAEFARLLGRSLDKKG